MNSSKIHRDNTKIRNRFESQVGCCCFGRRCFYLAAVSNKKEKRKNKENGTPLFIFVLTQRGIEMNIIKFLSCFCFCPA